MFVDPITNSPLEFVEHKNTSMYRTHTTGIPMFQIFSATCVFVGMTRGTKLYLGWLGLKPFGTGLSEMCRTFSRALIPCSRKRWKMKRLPIRIHTLLKSVGELSEIR